MQQSTYFGLVIIDSKYVLEEDIKKLPFYDFWKESSIGSGMIFHDAKVCVHLSDWESFSVFFIKSGKHRLSK